VVSVGVLHRKTYQGVPEVVDCVVSIVIGRPRTRRYAQGHGTRFIQVRATKVASPTSCLGDQVWCPALGVGWIRYPARYLALLYIVQGAGS
jgi:hypothetical protein